MLPWKVHFLTQIATNPDLYGPFWIATTVVFVMFVVGNMAGSVDAYQKGHSFSPNFTHLSLAATVVYSYVSLAPLTVWLGFKYYSVQSSLIELMCLYGYALAVFIPVSVRPRRRGDGAGRRITPCSPERARPRLLCPLHLPSS